MEKKSLSCKTCIVFPSPATWSTVLLAYKASSECQSKGGIVTLQKVERKVACENQMEGKETKATLPRTSSKGAATVT